MLLWAFSRLSEVLLEAAFSSITYRGRKGSRRGIELFLEELARDFHLAKEGFDVLSIGLGQEQLQHIDRDEVEDNIPEVIPEKMSSKNGITFIAVGDIALNNRFIEIIEKGYGDKIIENVKHCFGEGDINFANLDSTLSDRGKKDTKGQLVLSSSESASFLKKAGFNVISLANNHICDYGFEGCADTVRYLADSNINCFGVGHNLKASRKPLVINCNGITVGFLGYICKTTHGKNSTKNGYGSPLVKYQYIKQDLKELSFNADIKVVSLHWGFEQYNYPSPKQIRLAHRIIDAGADLIIGHHPHVLQGIEIYKGKPIFYSLGNFIFDDVISEAGGCFRWGEENKTSMIVRFNISAKKVSISELIPVRLSTKFQLELVCGDEKEVLLKKVGSLSQAVKVNKYGKFWKNLRIEKELKRKYLIDLDYKYLIKNMHKVRFRHLNLKRMIRLDGKFRPLNLKRMIRSNVKHLLIKLGLNPSQYH